MDCAYRHQSRVAYKSIWTPALLSLEMRASGVQKSFDRESVSSLPCCVNVYGIR